MLDTISALYWEPFKRVKPSKNTTKSESEVAHSCPTLCNPMDCSLPGSSVHGIFQARVLEWIAISFSRGFSQLRDGNQVSCIVNRCFTIWATREDLLFAVWSVKQKGKEFSCSVWAKEDHHMDSQIFFTLCVCRWLGKHCGYWFWGYKKVLESRWIGKYKIHE